MGFFNEGRLDDHNMARELPRSILYETEKVVTRGKK